MDFGSGTLPPPPPLGESLGGMHGFKMSAIVAKKPKRKGSDSDGWGSDISD
jgi:hypothetical protein